MSRATPAGSTSQGACPAFIWWRVEFEIRRIELHKLVSVAGIAVLAADFAAPVGIDGPAEGHVGFGAVQDTPRRNFEILHAALGFEQFALGSESGDPHECHNIIFAFYSPIGKRFVRVRKPFVAPLAGIYYCKLFTPRS